MLGLYPHLSILCVGHERYIWNVIYAQSYISNICTLLPVAWLMPVTSYVHIYVHTSNIYAHEVLGIHGIDAQ